MKMAIYIMNILRTQPMIIFSWGFHSALAIENGLRFMVNGFKHKGWVEVVYDEGTDTFIARTIKNGNITNEVSDVYLDCLVSTIDSMVEKTDDYKDRITNQYKLNA